MQSVLLHVYVQARNQEEICIVCCRMVVYIEHHKLCTLYTIHCVQCTHYIGYIGHFTLYTRERNAAGLTAQMQIYIFIEVSKDNKDNDDNDNDSDDNDDGTDKGDDGSDNSVSDGDNPDLAPVPGPAAHARMPRMRRKDRRRQLEPGPGCSTVLAVGGAGG